MRVLLVLVVVVVLIKWVVPLYLMCVLTTSPVAEQYIAHMVNVVTIVCTYASIAEVDLIDSTALVGSTDQSVPHTCIKYVCYI